jgi:DNA-binding CsgD family transcriptional regulator
MGAGVADVGSTSTERLLGRGRELGLLRDFVERTRVDGEALLVFGDPGVGKTALLDVAARLAADAGATVLRAGGVEFEADVPYAGLHQVLLPLHEGFARIGAAHREALEVALGFGLGPAPARLVVANAALLLLRGASVSGPVLVIVDDLPWLDRASALVLGFVARRLAGARVGLLAASRSGEESFFDRAGLPELELGPLDQEASRGLIDRYFPNLAPAVRERLMAEARGNALALLELPAALTQEQRAALPALPPLLPVSRRLADLFAARIDRLPAKTRQELLLLALDGTGDLRVLRSGSPDTLRLEDLAPAEQARLIDVDSDTYRTAFRHPLIRSTMVELSTAADRRDAHELLARLWQEQPDRRAWHLAHARTEPDEEVADLLERAAYHNLRRGDGVAAVSALTRAADLSPRGVDRGRRLAEAAYIGTDVTGELGNASQLLADAHRADPQFTQSLHAAATAAVVLLNGDGDVQTAHRLLVGAIEGTDELDRTALEEALSVLAVVCFFGAREEMWAPFDEALARLEPDVPLTLYLIGTCFADPLYRGAAALPRLESAIAQLATETDPTVIVKTAFAAGNTDRMSECRDALLRVALEGRNAGSIGSAIQALVVLAFEAWWSGEWDESIRLADEALELCATHGFPLFAFSVRHPRGAVAAARGDDVRLEAEIDAMVRWAKPRGGAFVTTVVAHLQALAASGKGDFEATYRLTTAISPAGTLRHYERGAPWVMMDVVESAIRTSRVSDAQAHLAAMRAANVGAVSPRWALLAAGAEAIAASDDDAPDLFAKATAIPGVERWPFYLARVELAWGERLRRLRAMTESRVHLNGALATFELLGARPWADRAAQELRATGQVKPRGKDRDRDALTPQEREIALLAASGMSNKEIGQRLFLSPRTIGAHLYRIFPKLGITSRAALRDALDRLPQQEHEPTELPP